MLIHSDSVTPGEVIKADGVYGLSRHTCRRQHRPRLQLSHEVSSIAGFGSVRTTAVKAQLYGFILHFDGCSGCLDDTSCWGHWHRSRLSYPRPYRSAEKQIDLFNGNSLFSEAGSYIQLALGLAW